MQVTGGRGRLCYGALTPPVRLSFPVLKTRTCQSLAWLGEPSREDW